MAVDEADDLFVDLANQDHLDHVHRRLVGDADPVVKFGLNPHLFKDRADLRTTAVHHNGIHPYVAQHDDVLGEAFLELFVDHGVAAVLDHNDLAVEASNIGQRLHQYGGTLHQVVHVGNTAHFHTSNHPPHRPKKIKPLPSL